MKVCCSRSCRLPLTLRAQYICVVGGVVSGLGKGITISSIGVIMKACGLRVS